jgi:hypothetical protein
MKHDWKRIRAIALPALLVAGTLATAAAPASGAAEPAARKPVIGTSSSPFGRTSAVLSSRLSQLATPDMQARSTAEQSAAVGLVESGPGSLMVRDGGLVVDIRVVSPSTATQQALTAAGATITNVDAGTNVITATVPAESLEAVGSVAGVQSVHEQLEPMVGSQGRAALAAADGTTSATCAPITSEGVTQLKADIARSTYSVDGTGVKVGVLSDSFNNLGGAATGVSNGELPGAGNPCGRTTAVQVLQDASSGGADEGRGMAELVHDVAPGSPLAFATAMPPSGEAGFANNIRNLANAGAKVIVDDVTYYDEPMYQDGIVAKAVNDVTAQGVSYFSSAGNENVLDSSGREIGSYEATGGYRPATCPALASGDWADGGYSDCHDFDPTSGVSSSDTFTIEAHSSVIFAIGWNEPQYAVPTDFDAFIVNAATNTIISQSVEIQDDTKAASEVVTVVNNGAGAGQVKLVIARYKNPDHPSGGTPRFKAVMFARRTVAAAGTPVPSAQFHTSSNGDAIGPTIYGHNAAINGATVAAVPYNNSAAPETFSSRGPAIYCYRPVTGTTVAAGPLPSCRTKHVDIAATDGGQTSFFGTSSPPYRFYGTSAAAPHAAGVAALQFQAKPCANQADILGAQKASARVVGSYGVTAVGSGLIDANGAIAAMSTCSATKFHSVNPTRVLESRNIPGNTGGYTTRWGPGITRSVDVTDTNGSGVPETGVSAVVLNVTVTDTDAYSYLSLFPNGNAQPQTGSNLNWSPGKTIANLVTVKVGTAGRIAIYNEAGNSNVIADVVGWYDDGTVAGQLYNSVAPTRVLDSRTTTGDLSGPWGAGVTRTLDVIGSPTAVVPSGATAVVLNVTVTDTTTGGFATVFPADVGTVPTASNINWAPGNTIPNLVTVRLGTGGSSTLGKVKIYNAVGSTNIIADVVGYYSATGAGFHVLSPTRVLDSRTTTGNLSGPWGAGATRQLDVTNTYGSGVPASGAQAVIMNVTVTDTSTAGFLTLFPATTSSVPNASNLNWSAHDTIPNLTITKVATSGSDNIKIYNAVGSTNVIADIVGWFG